MVESDVTADHPTGTPSASTTRTPSTTRSIITPTNGTAPTNTTDQSTDTGQATDPGQPTSTDQTTTTPTATLRLDAAIPARGLARSRTAAAALIAAGRVTIDGVPVVKASTPVSAAADIVVDAEDEWVSRAAVKLVGALDAFGVDPSGRTILDVGASTGGFTQVLLARGASRVIALDVGHGQLAPVIARDERVVVVEGVNARNLTSTDYLALDPAAERTSLVVGDLSFISLRMVLPALVEAVPADDFVLLVKPQFEVGRTGIREGIVRDASLRQDALMNVLWAAWDLGLGTAGLAPSPIVGTHGNHEYLARLQRGAGENPTEWILRATELAEGAP
ncbi:23S rRNA (cytidine1920-2'-O)/16S rRNA (cytidine1409-2'-O)-methyltransferase [Curtobacterium flaccumfaciens]|uniref:23S rRNA (Cytidine1920-2'-O)/16S rRNA (Cytidine1409-2'-O)-methyltransferase n=1 Tax=Curtobacterium salicis TaxID=1779862 RepID=A0ABX0TAR6_9MICO|nr:23S rRNA (cytidine1920-2'-O)/16S rRNA (cytidine1409-2'-O)-methyltransferase [Curtobacterium sp. WW7]